VSTGVTAEVIARALGGCKSGGGWTARCPAHDGCKPSLSIRETDNGKVLGRCHAGCDQQQVIAAPRLGGLWTKDSPRFARSAPHVAANDRWTCDDAKRIKLAPQSVASASGTLVESYLVSRSASPPAPDAPLPSRAEADISAMIALVTRGFDDTPLAIHRTCLTRDGNGKASVDLQKMMFGPCRADSNKRCKMGAN
jgi:hypothetical protein